jgi:hypothetical protein
VTYFEIFIYTAFIKAVNSRKNNVFIYKNQIKLLAVYMMVLFLLSYFIGMSGQTLLKSIKWILPWSLIYTIPRLMSNIEDWDNFFALLFPVVFISIIFQIAHLILGFPISQFLGSDYLKASGEYFSAGEIIGFDRRYGIFRIISSVYISLIAMIAAMNYLGSKRKIFSEKYLNFIILLSYLNIFLSGTRGWIIAITIGLMIYALFIDNRFFLRLRFVPVLIVVVVLALTVPVFQNQLDAVLFRANTMSLLAAGDISAGKSSSRLDQYSPPVIDKFLEFPIFGWGFSDVARATANGHVGMPTLLMQVGIVGFGFILYFWWKLFSVPIKMNRRLGISNPYKKGLLALTVGFLILFITHSTSGQQFSYLIGFYGSSIAQLIFYGYSDVLMKSAVITEYELREA